MDFLNRTKRIKLSLAEIKKNENEISRQNFQMLNIMSIVAVLVLVPGLLISYFTEDNTLTLQVAVAIFALMALFAVLSWILLHQDSTTYTFRYSYWMLVIYNLALYGTTIVIGVVNNRESVAVTFLLLIVLLPSVFVWSPAVNLSCTLFAAIALGVASYYCKAPEVWIADVRNTVMALLLSFPFGYINTKMRLELIASNSNLQDENEHLSEINAIDQLTGVFNKATIEELLARSCGRCRDYKGSAFAAIMDIDHFKEYNDNYGHPAGDDVLRKVGGVLSEIAGEYSLDTGRVGGEEFMLVGSVGSEAQAAEICEKLRQRVEELNIEHGYSKVLPVLTISVGAVFMGTGDKIEAKDAYERADKALYVAKRSGKNKVEIYR